MVELAIKLAYMTLLEAAEGAIKVGFFFMVWRLGVYILIVAVCEMPWAIAMEGINVKQHITLMTDCDGIETKKERNVDPGIDWNARKSQLSG